jgi:hypothetical protein
MLLHEGDRFLIMSTTIYSSMVDLTFSDLAVLMHDFHIFRKKSQVPEIFYRVKKKFAKNPFYDT